MDNSSVAPKTSCHARSTSLPSTSHPLTVSVEAHLCRLRASYAGSSSPSSICHNLGVLSGLYEDVHNLLQLPLIQQDLSNSQHGKCLEEVLGSSLWLLDVCGIGKDALLLMRECFGELASSIRRSKGMESTHADDVKTFMISRKNVKKMVHKCFGSFKKTKNCKTVCLGKDYGHLAIVKAFRDVEAGSLPIFQSILSFASGSKQRSSSNAFSLVANFMKLNQLACVEEEGLNEIRKMDAALAALWRQKSNKKFDTLQVQNVQKQLEAVELNFQELEEGLECLFRQLVKIRFSLLNILNH